MSCLNERVFLILKQVLWWKLNYEWWVTYKWEGYCYLRLWSCVLHALFVDAYRGLETPHHCHPSCSVHLHSLDTGSTRWRSLSAPTTSIHFTTPDHRSRESSQSISCPTHKQCSILNLVFLVLSYVYSKQPIFWLTQEWFRELSFSRLECGVHDKLHISSADWWDLLLPLA